MNNISISLDFRGITLTAIPSHVEEVNTAFKNLLEEFCCEDLELTESMDQVANYVDNVCPELDEEEEKTVDSFLKNPCPCLKNCQQYLDKNELVNSRSFYRSLGKKERNYVLLTQLKSFLSHSKYSISARSKRNRERKKFDYRIGIDRPVCQAVFLFYYGESSKRLDRLKGLVSRDTIIIPVHGNSGRKPQVAYDKVDREKVKAFICNFKEIHGLPDPGRDVRKGKGKLRVLLPSIMSFQSVHEEYRQNIEVSGGTLVGYRTFISIWQTNFPHLKFNDPRSDLCMTCEDFKKRLNQVAAALNEGKDKKREQLHRDALLHLKHAKRERLYYKANAKVANDDYKKVNSKTLHLKPNKPNSKNIMAHYSWDFAQQLHYPFESQQVGPIFFKTPRKAHLFGVCSEGIPRQYNYLIDEENFHEKNANTVISLLDHFFTNYGLGEKWVHLTSDNFAGQNKNNALIQYLMYRILTGLHSKIELSFLIVGHTKFSPDGYFGLIKRKYRRSEVYTYEQLAHIVESSSKNGHNVCIRGPIICRDWTSWLSQYFTTFKGISKYHHFLIQRKKSSIIVVKERQDSEEIEIEMTKKKFPFSKAQPPRRPPKRLVSDGLPLKRQWYLYDKIRCHIPDKTDKDMTCPKPKISKSKIEMRC